MLYMKNLNFRKATNFDCSQIAAIHNINVRGTSPKHNGFLLTQITEEQILQKLENGVEYFVATSNSDEILGFVTVSIPKIDNTFLNQVIWQDDAYRDKIAKDKNLYIQIVAVKPNYMSQGIGQFMYKSLYEEFSTSFFTTFVVAKPIKNLRSLLFHEKQGFLQVGVVRHKRLLDLENYESILLLRE